MLVGQILLAPVLISVALLVYWYIFLIDVLAVAEAFSFLFNY